MIHDPTHRLNSVNLFLRILYFKKDWVRDNEIWRVKKDSTKTLMLGHEQAVGAGKNNTEWRMNEVEMTVSENGFKILVPMMPNCSFSGPGLLTCQWVFCVLKTSPLGTSLVAQCLRLHTSTSGCTGSISGWGTKIQHASCCGQINKHLLPPLLFA